MATVAAPHLRPAVCVRQGGIISSDRLTWTVGRACTAGNNMQPEPVILGMLSNCASRASRAPPGHVQRGAQKTIPQNSATNAVGRAGARGGRLSEEGLAKGMRAAQAGDLEAYSEVLRSVTPVLRRLIARKRSFNHTADVEDIVQDVLLSVHAARRTYDPARPFMPWLLAIAHHRLADAARRQALRRSHEVPADDPSLGYMAYPDPRGEIFGDASTIHRAVGRLPVRQKAALELLKLKEMSLRDAAAEMGTTVGALKVLAHRAMASLRRSLLANPASE